MAKGSKRFGGTEKEWRGGSYKKGKGVTTLAHRRKIGKLGRKKQGSTTIRRTRERDVVRVDALEERKNPIAASYEIFDHTGKIIATVRSSGDLDTAMRKFLRDNEIISTALYTGRYGIRRVTPKKNPARKQHVYEVTVGNIGLVHDGHSLKEATKEFSAYKAESKSGRGRAGGEQVVLWKDGEPVKEYEGEQYE